MTKTRNSPLENEKPKGFLETIKQQIKDNPKKTALLAVMIAAAPIAPILTVAAGVIIVGNAGVTGYKTNKLQKEYNQAHPPKGPQKPKNMLGNLGQKIMKNKGKALLVGLTATIFPAGTIIAASILAGTAVKAGLDSRKENKAFQQGQTPPSSSLKGPQKPKNMLGNLGQKIMKNKGKALLVGLTATIFPAGTIIAASILAGTAVKAGLDSRKENKAFQQAQTANQTTTKPAAAKFVPKPISPEQTPVISHGKSKSQSR